MPGNAGGNARDNRQRGNAAQLLEKYKSLARDAQLAGDRVQTEYYLQYADHYFRVLEDSRSRFDEQQAQRRPRRDEEEYDSEGDEDMAAQSEDGDDEGVAEVRQRPQQRRERPERPQRDRFAGDRGDRPQRDRANGARRDEENESDGEERIALGVLPPSIGAGDDQAEEETPKPRRRARKPRVEDESDDIAPAA
jgi:arylsulfatase A-like enzyme